MLAIRRFVPHSLSPLSSINALRAFSSSTPSVRRLLVVGCGQMGTGIGYVGALSNVPHVYMLDSNPEQRTKSLQFIRSLLKKDESKGKITPAAASAAESRFSFIGTEGLSDIKESIDFVIEAATENESLKVNILKSLNGVLHSKTIVASNTSSISITSLASSLPSSHQSHVIGMHFMNPVPVMKLVEIIPGLQTSEETVERTKKFAGELGKTVTQSIDHPGFIANRLLMPYINEAILALQEGVGTKEDIDTTMKLGTGVPMGPLTLADFIGLDTCLAIMKVLHNGFGDPKYRPAVLLQQMVSSGRLGKKTGMGFYNYEGGKQS